MAAKGFLSLTSGTAPCWNCRREPGRPSKSAVPSPLLEPAYTYTPGLFLLRPRFRSPLVAPRPAATSAWTGLEGWREPLGKGSTTSLEGQGHDRGFGFGHCMSLATKNYQAYLSEKVSAAAAIAAHAVGTEHSGRPREGMLAFCSLGWRVLNQDGIREVGETSRCYVGSAWNWTFSSVEHSSQHLDFRHGPPVRSLSHGLS